MHAVLSAFEQRLVLRLASREEHLLAGAALGGYRHDRAPGSALWAGSEVQIATPASPPPAWRAPLPEIDLREGAWAVATPRPRDVLARLGSIPERVVVADIDVWLTDHAGLSVVRREGRLVLIACTSADHRALTRTRVPLPPLGGTDEAWLVEAGTTSRVRVRFA